MKRKINFKGFIDTTLREGQASPLMFDTRKYFFSPEEKKKIIEALIRLGLSHFEFYSPVVGKKEREDFLAIKEYVRKMSPKKVVLIAHCRCHPDDINQAVKAGFGGLNLYMGLSAEAEKNYGKSFLETLKLIKDLVVSTRKKYPYLWLRYSGEDAFRTPLKRIFRVYDEIAPYVDTFGTPDTTGIATPDLVKKRIRSLKKRYPKNNLECHFHNDSGYALINTITAIENGAEYIDSTIWGMGERSGISSITGTLLNLYYLDSNLTKNYNLDLCYPVNVLMGSILKMQVPYNEPVSLTNRTHIAGVHQKAVLNVKKSYEAYSLEKFGVTKKQLLLGPLTGWNFIYYYLKEMCDFIISPEEAKKITSEFKERVEEIRENQIKPEELLDQIAEKYSLAKIDIPREHKERRIENLNGN